MCIRDSKSLAAVSTSKFTETELDTIDKDPASYYIQFGDTGLVQGGKVRAGEWIDVIRFRDWLKNDMQTRVVNLLVKNSKIPYTDKGIGLVRNQVIASLKEGTRRGGIAEDPVSYTHLDVYKRQRIGRGIKIPV